MAQGSVRGSLLFKLYTFEFCRIVGNRIVGYALDTSIYAVIPRPLSSHLVMKSQNQDLTVINCLKWHMRLASKKTKSMVFNRFRTVALGYVGLTLVIAELEETKGLRILGVTLDSNLTVETHLRELVLKAARGLGVVRRTGKLFNCPLVLKSYFNAHVLSSLKHCTSL